MFTQESLLGVRGKGGYFGIYYLIIWQYEELFSHILMQQLRDLKLSSTTSKLTYKTVYFRTVRFARL